MSEHQGSAGPTTGSLTRPGRHARSSGLTGSLQLTDLGGDRTGLRAAGEIDVSSHQMWTQALRRMVGRPGDVHLDLASLRFIDARSTAQLVQVAGMLNAGRRLVLHHPPPCLLRVLTTLWPEDMSTIVIEGGAA